MNRNIFIRITFIAACFLCIFIIKEKKLLQPLQFFNRGFRGNKMVELKCGYEATGIFLLRCKPNKGAEEKFLPIEFSGDDPGIYLLTQVIDKYVFHSGTLFGKPTIILSFYLVIFSMILAGFGIFVAGSFLLFGKHHFWKLLLAGVVLVFFCLYILDVYISFYFVTSFIPLLIYGYKKLCPEKPTTFFLVMISFAFLCGTVNVVRSQSGTGMFLFMLPLLYASSKKWIPRFAALAGMIFMLTLPGKLFSLCIEKRNSMMAEKNISVKDEGTVNHVVWHALYIGLAFCENKYHIEEDDNYLFKKVRQEDSIPVNLGYITANYENAVKKKFMAMVKNDWLFVLKTWFMKSTYAVLFFLLIGMLGFLMLFHGKSSTDPEILFAHLITLAFYTIPAILVWPYPMYFLGGICTCFYMVLFIFWDIKPLKEAILPQ